MSILDCRIHGPPKFWSEIWISFGHVSDHEMSSLVEFVKSIDLDQFLSILDCRNIWAPEILELDFGQFWSRFGTRNVIFGGIREID